MVSLNGTVPTATGSADILAAYHKFIGRKIALIILCLVLIVLLIGGAATLGAARLTIAEVYGAIINRIVPGTFEVSPLADSIVWNIRLPRILMGLLAGFGLGMAGAVMQAVLRNPLASPYTLGISAAAGFGASLAIVLGAGLLAGRLLIVGNAFIFSLLCSMFVLALSGRHNVTPQTMILAGIALMYLFSAGITLIQFIGDPYAVQATVFWIAGDVGRTSWEKLLI
ncbi:MAG: iron ABC transporter permease, partial [Dehalococcoidia bacterium]|nr:iron ABC transporter permease [Dehalococcoidia bacterium]